MEISFRKANGFQRFHDVYEWQPQGSQKWYQIHRVNILALEGETEILNAALQGETINLSALYLRRERLLLLARD